ncbi:hypothetical protein BUALT_Bualt06G0049100 [Buddleja alternifolia]|uniref:Uncharacterized protein n=1 Tax=Buddleja alternifolia TaxID=168488 RepID=A0AAV6XCF9_9LAMI|nr:hypothetical protein BUALT_Bualt06G0049100 [Buddleja alternifolia]
MLLMARDIQATMGRITQRRGTFEFGLSDSDKVPSHAHSKPFSNQQRRLNSHKIDEKRSKGLCFRCYEKFSREHICKNRRQIYLMEGSLEVESDDSGEEDEQGELEEEDSGIPGISYINAC